MKPAAPKIVEPGAMIGVFGGGQLGRMFVHAAQRMGYRVSVYTPHAGSPAGQAADHEWVGLMTDQGSVARFSESVEAATLEFENVPTESIRTAERCTSVRPGSEVLHITQHRLREKRFLEDAGAPVGPFEGVESEKQLREAVERIGLPAVLKTCQMGYDGKGQRVLRDHAELTDAWEALGPGPCLLEGFVDFRGEVSVLVARGADGETAFYGPIANDHENHILDVSAYPDSTATAKTKERAREIAGLIARGLDAIGLICIEMFELPSGELLVNEIAPRPHNSGHLTIEGCRTSQFEQQVRALCGLPLGSPEVVAPAAMANLLGDLWLDEDDEIITPDWVAALEAGASLHLYGKESPRRGRKMGHLTAVGSTPEEARMCVVRARDSLSRS